MRTSILLAALAAAALAGCDSGDQPETIPLPDRTLRAETLDTVVWSSREAELARGKEVFGWACARCHGATGEGDAGGTAESGDTLRPPSFRTPDWRFANDARGLAEYIYTGNEKGMPHWGAQGIQPRDVVALASYIQQDLRAGR